MQTDEVYPQGQIPELQLYWNLMYVRKSTNIKGVIGPPFDPKPIFQVEN